MGGEAVCDAPEVIAQTSREGRSYIDLENEKNAERILSKMNAYHKIKVKKRRNTKKNTVPETA